MGELSSYTLSDFLMFSPEVYFRLYERYNEALWPAQLLAVVVGLALIGLTRTSGERRSRVAGVLVAAAWAWIAWGFLLRYYAEINLAAPYFAALFLLQALLLLLAAVTGELRSAWQAGAGGRAAPVGLALFVFAMVILPLAGPLTGRAWASVELFALAPDPTAVGTLGILLMTRSNWRWWLAAIPLLWCLVSGVTYMAMDVPAGLLAPLAAFAALILTIPRP